MKKLGILMLIGASLTGCVTWGDLDQGLNNLRGKPISAAIERIGYPSSEQVIAGKKLYRWERTSQGVQVQPTTSFTSGKVGSGNNPAKYTETKTGSTMVQVNNKCSLTLAVDQHDNIISHQYDGNLDGCSTYINAFKR